MVLINGLSTLEDDQTLQAYGIQEGKLNKVNKI